MKRLIMQFFSSPITYFLFREWQFQRVLGRFFSHGSHCVSNRNFNRLTLFRKIFAADLKSRSTLCLRNSEFF
jgi:hypothetical protein